MFAAAASSTMAFSSSTETPPVPGGLGVGAKPRGAAPPPVTGAAGLGKLLAAEPHPRAGEVALVHRPRQAELTGPDVADRREPAQQHALQSPPGPRRHIGRRPLGHGEDV